MKVDIVPHKQINIIQRDKVVKIIISNESTFEKYNLQNGCKDLLTKEEQLIYQTIDTFIPDDLFGNGSVNQVMDYINSCGYFGEGFKGEARFVQKNITSKIKTNYSKN